MIKLKDGTKIMMKDEREPFHKHDNWHNNIVHWKDSSCPTCIKEGIKQGYAKALDDVGKYMRRRIIEQINKGKDLFSGGWILQEITKLEKTK